MNSETKICQSCKRNFIIEPEDFSFYEKVSVPPPTFCADCRLQRRLSFRSGHQLYKRRVGHFDKEVFSPFPPGNPHHVVHEKWWWSDEWNPMDYGRDYNFSKPFFEQLRELQLAVPMPHRRVINAVNSDYCENSVNVKDCYLCFNAGFTENSLYSESINGCKECIDTLKVHNCELSYELFDCEKCFRCFFSSHCSDCVDVYFSIDLVGCQNCFGCINLRNKNYYIFNKPYSKEEYFKILKEYDLGSAKKVDELKAKIKNFSTNFPVKYLRGRMNINSTGDFLDNCKNARKCFYSRNLQDCAYCQLILFVEKSSDCMDISIAGGELCYELEEAGGYGVKFSWICIPSNTLQTAGFVDLRYCLYCFGANSSHLFGCVGLRDKQYCILNKQYTKEEYEKLVPKIVKHMNEMPYISEIRNSKSEIRKIEYKYGEFLPPEFSPLPYNETWAQEYFPLVEMEAKEKNFYWHNPEPKSHSAAIKSADLPDNTKDINDSILENVIECANRNDPAAHGCAGVFRIIPRELEFYRRMNLPLPRLCYNCRHYQRASQRNPLKLRYRRCRCNGKSSENGNYRNLAVHFHNLARCPNEFETSYAPERREIVYCEQCYNAEIV